MLTRPGVTEEILAQIRQIIKEHPDWGRRSISIHLCELWDWRIPGSHYKDISCRDMLRALDKAGHIKLPAPQRTFGQNPRRKVAHKEHDRESIVCGLSDLRPLIVDVVEGGPAMAEFKTFVERSRFRGVCYQAANWIRVGKTAGRGRNDRQKARALPEKDIYLMPLNRRWRKYLLSKEAVRDDTQ